MKALIGKRIRSARRLAGLSMRDLVSRMDDMVSHNAISKYEKGLMMPNSKVLSALAKALNVKIDYFFRSNDIEISDIEFRKKSKFGKKQVNSLNEKVNDIVSRYIELEEILQIQSDFYNPIKDYVIKNESDVEQVVDLLLEKWEIGYNAIPNVLDLLEENNIKVIEIDTQDEFDGLSGWANSSLPIVVVNKNFTIERKRFTALHELGHLLMTFDNALDPRTVERFCHQFAGAVLVPRITFFKELGEKRKSVSLEELISMKESYGISIQAIMARAKTLDVISQEYFVKFRQWISKDPDRRKEIGLGEYVGVESTSRFNQLLHRAAAEEIITMSKAASLSNVKLATFRDQFFAL